MTVDIGVVGAGGMAETHADNFDSVDARLVGVCSRTEESARELAESHGAETYPDAETMFRTGDLDAVLVTVPPSAHGEYERLAAEHGVDFFVEKPLALSRETARDVRDAVEAADLVTQVGHQFRYADIVERAHELLGDRTLAQIEGRWVDAVSPLPWWSRKAESGGQLVEQSAHVFDLVRDFGGEVADLAAFGGHRVVTQEIDFADASVVAMRHDSGVVSQVASTSASPEKDVSLELVAEDCRLELDFVAGTLTGTVDDESIRFEGEQRPYERELAAFVEAVETDDPSHPRSTYPDALRTFELTLDADEALDIA
ncbi:Gfo/Idh/MocA family oxidoreductase [Halomicroarcula limicola]|uniref:Gfo/Idh/MocA family oxidoreductase n=1 Tax=Haloarcula limicola TaxID=1429915 RepID=A0A8J8C5X2_9EURY|nr:Gfo/Idh/MocA family oxidoreductase [Halomicroarcula limicola]MBV0925664.1 Gfo/Idh/MocA family oxidoreductase [Halomicroarcula limicola]